MTSEYSQEHIKALVQYFKQELPDNDPYYALAQDMVKTYINHHKCVAQLGNILHDHYPLLFKFQGFWNNR